MISGDADDSRTECSQALAGDAELPGGAGESWPEPDKRCLVTVTVICFYSQNEVVWETQKTCTSNNDDCNNSYFIFCVVPSVVSVK